MTNKVTKLAQMFADFWGEFKKYYFKEKMTFATFWATFGNLGLLFISTYGRTYGIMNEQLPRNNMDSCLTNGSELYG